MSVVVAMNDKRYYIQRSQEMIQESIACLKQHALSIEVTERAELEDQYKKSLKQAISLLGLALIT